MPHISLRVTEQEKKMMESYARLHNVSLSDAIKEAFFEKLEDELDLQAIREYEANPDKSTISQAEMEKSWGLNKACLSTQSLRVSILN